MRIEMDRVYGTGGGRELKLDIYSPEGAPAARAAIVLVHGGGWRNGNKGANAIFAEAITAQGFVAIAPEYRLLGESAWPAQLDDLKAAIAWVAANAADLGIDPARIAVQGFSAGGHMALLAAAEEAGVRSPVAAVIAFFPPVELTTEAPGPGAAPAANLLGEAPEAAAARLASPVHRIDAGFPPTFLLHGAQDWLAGHEHSLRMFDALIAAGVKAELHIFAGHAHEFVRLPSMLAPVQAEIGLFLRRMMVDPETYEAEDRDHNIFQGSRELFMQRLGAGRHP